MTILWPLGQGTPSVAALERTVAPAVQPITLSEVKAQCRVSDTDSDTLLTSLIAAAVDLVDGDGALGRAMITQTWAQWVPLSPARVRLRMGPFQELTGVHYYDADGVLQEATLSDYEIRKAGDFVTVEPKSGFAWPSTQSRGDAIRLTYVAGFGDAASDVPQGIRHALLMLVAHWYENREASTDLNLRDAPMAVDALLNRHRVAWYG